MAIGVYKITNIVNNKFYIGSTRRLSERKAEHKYKLSNYKGNSIIRNAVLKYGTNNFKFEVLEEFIIGNFASPKYIDELITSREQYFVDILHPQYNIKIKDVTSSKSIPRNVSDNLSIELSKREIRRRKEKIDKRIEIDVYETETLSFIETILGVRNCGLKYGIDGTQVSEFCKRGYTSLYKGKYIYCYHGDDITKSLRERKKIKPFQRPLKCIPIIQVDKQGNFIKEWKSAKDATKELDLHRGAISRVLSGKYVHTKNYYFKLKNQLS